MTTQIQKSATTQFTKEYEPFRPEGTSSSTGVYGSGCKRHINHSTCDKCKNKNEPWTYPEYYSNWECRKEKCKPQYCPGKPFYYNGVYGSQKCCPPLTNWTELFNRLPSEKTQVVDPPVEDPPVEAPPVEDPPVEDPPVEDPPVEDPPVEDPPVEVVKQ